MRIVSRSLNIIAGFAALSLVVTICGWVTRHAWVPGLVNHQLDGLRVTQFQGLELVRTDQGISAQIDHLRLITEEQFSIDLNGITVSKLPALLRGLLRSTTPTPPQSAVIIEYLNLTSYPGPTAGAGDVSGDNAVAGAVPGDAKASRLPPENETPNGSEDSVGLALGETLNLLRYLPVQNLEIRHIRWPSTIAGDLSISAEHSPAHRIRGDLRSNRCAECRLQLGIEIEKPQAKITLKLLHGLNAIAQLDTLLTPQDVPVNEHQPNEWHFDSQLDLATEQLSPLLQQVGVHSDKSEGWLDIVQSLNGNLALKIQGQTSNRIHSLADLRNLTAALDTRAISLLLPEKIAGLPLATEITTVQPINLRIVSVEPLSTETIEGKVDLRVGIQTTPRFAGITQPLLGGSITLSTMNNISGVQFRGQAQLDEVSRLWQTDKWKDIRGRFPVTAMRGTASFAGNFTLPGLDGLLANSDTPEIRQFLTEISLDEEADFHLELPADDNPLTSVNWQKPQITLKSDGPIKVSAIRLPGKVDLEFSRLAFSAKEAGKDQQKVRAPPALQGELEKFRCIKLPAVNCTLQVNATIPELTLANASTSLHKLNLALAEVQVVSESNSGISISLRELNMSAEQGRSGDISIGKPELFGQQAKCQLKNGMLSCESPQLALSFDPLSIGDDQLRGVVFLEDLTITHHSDQPQNIQAAASFHADNLNIRALKQYKAEITTRGQWQFAKQQITGSSDIRGGPVTLNTSWQHNMKSGQGSLKLVLPKTEFSPKNNLGRTLHGLPLDIVGGQLEAVASLHWPESSNDQLQLTLTDTAVQYNDSFAVGINAQIPLRQKAGHWMSEKPVPVSVTSLDPGLAVNNLNFALSLAADGDLTLGNFSAELLEGALTSEKLTWNLKGEQRHSRLQFTGLSIGALAKEMESTNFAASGLLDASIPITIDRQGITVDKGTVQSRAPGGRLRYYGAFSPSMLGSNPQLKLLAGALEDYNYRDISGTMSYPLSGDLKLNLKLTGRSAAIDANRDLIINLNLENNVPSMLRSLQASRDLTDVLERQVQ